MKLIKVHFSVILSFFVLLCSLECILFVNKIINLYGENLINDYSIVVATEKSLDVENFKKNYSKITDVIELDSTKILKNFENSIPKQNIEALKASIPRFYDLKLNFFPNEIDLINLKELLLKNDNILEVEMFAKTHDKIYKMLKLMHAIVLFFTIIVCMVSILLLVKQMRIWLYEHQDRISIMTLFGASFWDKSSTLYKFAIIDAIIATILTIICFFIITNNASLLELFAELKIYLPAFDILKSGPILIVVSLVIAILSTTFVVLRVKNR